MNFFSIMNFFERCQKYMRAGDGKLTCDFPPPYAEKFEFFFYVM